MFSNNYAVSNYFYSYNSFNPVHNLVIDLRTDFYEAFNTVNFNYSLTKAKTFCETH